MNNLNKSIMLTVGLLLVTACSNSPDFAGQIKSEKDMPLTTGDSSNNDSTTNDQSTQQGESEKSTPASDISGAWLTCGMVDETVSNDEVKYGCAFKSKEGKKIPISATATWKISINALGNTIAITSYELAPANDSWNIWFRLSTTIVGVNFQINVTVLNSDEEIVTGQASIPTTQTASDTNQSIADATDTSTATLTESSPSTTTDTSTTTATNTDTTICDNEESPYGYYNEAGQFFADKKGYRYKNVCWYRSVAGQSCDTACGAHGGYNDATRTIAGSAGTDADCLNIANYFFDGHSSQWFLQSLIDASHLGNSNDIYNLQGTGYGCWVQVTGAPTYVVGRITSAETSSGAYTYCPEGQDCNYYEVRMCACGQ